MITNEREIRIALEATLACTLAFYGLWGCALLVVVLMLPWRPLLAAGAYLVQPIVDWRIRKVSIRREKGLAQLGRELEALLPVPGEPPARPMRAAALRVNAPLELPAATFPEEREGFVPPEICPAIRTHLQSFPHGVFSNMELEVEAVSLQGDAAEAYVRFKSLSVSGLVIRRRYVLCQVDGQWQVESLIPANGSSRSPRRC